MRGLDHGCGLRGEIHVEVALAISELHLHPATLTRRVKIKNGKTSEAAGGTTDRNLKDCGYSVIRGGWTAAWAGNNLLQQVSRWTPVYFRFEGDRIARVSTA